MSDQLDEIFVEEHPISFYKKKVEELQKFKDDFEENIKISIQREEKTKKKLEKTESILYQTERDRLRLNEETQELKKEIGKLSFVKIILEKAEIYGYTDIFKGSEKNTEKLK